MKLLLIATILSVCHAVANHDDIPNDAPNKPQPFYVANCIALRTDALGVSVRVPDRYTTTQACTAFGGRSCLAGCLLSGPRSREFAASFSRTCVKVNKLADVAEYQEMDKAELDAGCLIGR
jgi:hypothetical protein